MHFCSEVAQVFQKAEHFKGTAAEDKCCLQITEKKKILSLQFGNRFSSPASTPVGWI
jgi:hypothetical protein